MVHTLIINTVQAYAVFELSENIGKVAYRWARQPGRLGQIQQLRDPTSSNPDPFINLNAGCTTNTMTKEDVVTSPFVPESTTGFLFSWVNYCKLSLIYFSHIIDILEPMTGNRRKGCQRHQWPELVQLELVRLVKITMYTEDLYTKSTTLVKRVRYLNRLQRSGVGWLHFKVFSAIQV